LNDTENFELVLKLFGLRAKPSDIAQVRQIVDNIAKTDIERTLERMDFLTELMSELLGVSISFMVVKTIPDAILTY
jgi:hypothetical protein